jgi:predicted CXXCH cytochrome family protein
VIARRTAIGVGILALAAAGFAAARAVQTEIATPIDLRGVEYVRSRTCVRCHPDHYASWSRTFHRTMTQLAGPEAVLGDFEDARYTYGGVTSRFTRDGGRFFIETLDTDGAMKRFEVALTVGSRRVQQYVTQRADKRYRLPLAWNIEEGRWFHLNGGFLHPDGVDFNNHTTLWDANCTFCHNVKASPGYDWGTRRFDSEVAELGIACEACHAPGAEHIERNANPLRRYLLYASEARDPTIVWPRGLTKEREVQICGHCHGQRMPNPLERIDEFITRGDPYTAGDDLAHYTTPITMTSRLDDEEFAPRFWRDGTPRLTAYEYQGLLMSADYQRGELRCTSCHSMHGGDPRGMITEEMRGPAACLSCHAEIGRDVASHTKHDASGSGSDCYACHMPKIVYGLLSVHPTHRIQNPDPSRAWRHDMPEACTLCHTNQTSRWAADALVRLWPGAHPGRDDLEAPGSHAYADTADGADAAQPGGPSGAGAREERGRPDGPEWHVAENVRALLSGDVVQRAVAVMALADERSYTSAARARLWAAPFLILTMEDRYPAVRHFAHRALRQLAERAGEDASTWAAPVVAPPPPAFDALADPAERERAIAKSWEWWNALEKSGMPHPGDAVPLDENLAPDFRLVQTLRAMQESHAINIGE